MISEKLWCPAGVEKLSSIQLALLQNTETVLATSASIWCCSEFTSICFTSKFSFTFFCLCGNFQNCWTEKRVCVIPIMFLLGIVEAHFLCWKNGRVILQIAHYACLCVCVSVCYTFLNIFNFLSWWPFYYRTHPQFVTEVEFLSSWKYFPLQLPSIHQTSFETFVWQQLTKGAN